MRPVRNKDTWSTPLAGVLGQTISAYYDSLPRRPQVQVPRSAGDLERALASGAVKLRGSGSFIGAFNAQISRELRAMGGIYDGTAWVVPPANIPLRIRMLAREADEKNAGWVAQLGSAIQKMAPIALIAAPALPMIYRAIALKVKEGIEDTTGRQVQIPTDPDATTRFVMTVEESIRGFSERETRTISKLIRKATEQQWSAQEIESALMGRIGMGQDRARTIARQGVAVAATDLKASMYVQAGLPYYRWKTKGDTRVRSDHAVLDGQVFDWNNPPLVNTATGMHAHPGQDYRCRCEAIPLEDQ